MVPRTIHLIKDIELLSKVVDSGIWSPIYSDSNHNVHTAVRVTVEYTKKVEGYYGTTVREKGWLFSGLSGEPGDLPQNWVLLDNGDITLSTDNTTQLDLNAEIKAELETAQKSGAVQRRLDDIDVVEELYIWAAWLHQLGRDSDAGAALRQARELSLSGEAQGKSVEEKAIGARIRKKFAWFTLNAAANDHVLFLDIEALIMARRLKNVFPDFLDSCGEGDWLLADQVIRSLDRGAKKQTQEDALKRDSAEVISAQLRDLHIGHRDFDSDPVVKGLIERGDGVVPALFELARNDPNYTRTAIFFPFHHQVEVFPVRGMALFILWRIIYPEFADRKRLDIRFIGELAALFHASIGTDESRTRVESLLSADWQRKRDGLPREVRVPDIQPSLRDIEFNAPIVPLPK